MSRIILSIVVDTLVATALIIGGLGLHSVSGAPHWLMPLFCVPFLLYLHFRLDAVRCSYDFIALFTAFLMLAFFLVEHFVPREEREDALLLVVVFIVLLGQAIERRRQRAP